MKDTLEAPIGYKAIKTPKNSYGCELCIFSLPNDFRCYLESKTKLKNGGCSAEYREDNTNVYFIKEQIK